MASKRFTHADAIKMILCCLVKPSNADMLKFHGVVHSDRILVARYCVGSRNALGSGGSIYNIG